MIKKATLTGNERRLSILLAGLILTGKAIVSVSVRDASEQMDANVTDVQESGTQAALKLIMGIP